MFRAMSVVCALAAAAVVVAAEKNSPAGTKPGSSASKSAMPEGIWAGDPKGGPVDSTFAFEISEHDGKLSCTVHVVHGEVSFPAESATFADGKLTVDLGRGDSYAGTLDERESTIEGTLTLATTPAAMAVRRIEKVPVLNRPQHPTGKPPYGAEDVAFENTRDKVTLAGTLTIPEGKGPFPTVVLVSGSGPHDRNGSMAAHKPFWVLADYLTRRGIACLRFDDRGVGESSGDFSTWTGADYAADVHAAVAFLKSRPEIDRRRIGLCGHSEGGVVAPLVAAEHPDDIAFLVLLATVGTTGEELLFEQMSTAMQGMSIAVDAKTIREFAAEMTRLLKSDLGTEEANERIVELLLGDVPQDAPDRKVHEEGAKFMAAYFAGPGRRWLITRDPPSTLRRVRCPVLALCGGKDRLCKSRQNLDGIAAALRAGGNRDAACVELPDLNHLFQKCETGSQGEYARIDETFSPAALEKIGDWVAEKCLLSNDE